MNLEILRANIAQIKALTSNIITLAESVRAWIFEHYSASIWDSAEMQQLVVSARALRDLFVQNQIPYVQNLCESAGVLAEDWQDFIKSDLLKNLLSLFQSDLIAASEIVCSIDAYARATHYSSVLQDAWAVQNANADIIGSAAIKLLVDTAIQAVYIQRLIATIALFE